MAQPFAKAVTLLPGLAWCQSKCRPVIAPSLAASPSAGIAICARSLSKAPVPFCSILRAGETRFWTVAHDGCAAHASQCSDRCARQQVGADRLDRLGAR